MKRLTFCLLAATCLLMLSCSGKKKKAMTGEDAVNVQEFLDFFPETQLPFTYDDVAASKKDNDSLLIDQAIYKQFSSDSVTHAFLGAAKPRYYAVARFNANKESYIISKAVAAGKQVVLLNVYDKEFKPVASMPLLKVSNGGNGAQQSITIDTKLNINKNTIKSLPGGIEVEGHDIYVLNNAAKKFMLIMTDSLGDAASQLMNPIDTLSRTFKFSGDYGDGKNKLISIRDSKRPDHISFFIYLNVEKEGCLGELKGEALLKSTTQAEYRQGGDPCVLQFTFAGKSVTLSEVEGCGSRLGALQCSFNGSYNMVKPSKKAVEKPIESKPMVRRAHH